MLALPMLVCGLVVAGNAWVMSLQLSPVVSIDLTAPSQTSSVTLRNAGDQPINMVPHP